MKIQRQTHDIEVYRGDSIYEELEVLDSDDAAVDITDYTFRAQVRRSVDGDALATLVVEVTDAAAGTLTVTSTAPNEDWDLGPDGVGVWDLEATSDGATPIITTTHRGSIGWVEDVTK